MKNLKKVGIFALILAFALSLCTACGGQDASEEDKVIKVAASVSPHAEILAEVADVLAEDGWTLEVTEFDDYVQPNLVVDSGEFDANYFQHQPYLDAFNEENDTDIVSAGIIHYEPLGVYAAKKSSFDELEDGDLIGVPNDTTNEARALKLLEANGVIKLKEGAGFDATPNDIETYYKKITIKEIEAAAIPAALPDLALAVINGNFAIGGGLKVADAIAIEEADSEAAETYANIIACKAGNENSAKMKALVAALQTAEVKAFIEQNYAGAVKAMF